MLAFLASRTLTDTCRCSVCVCRVRLPAVLCDAAAIVNAAGPGSAANLQVDNFREQANAILKDSDVSVKSPAEFCFLFLLFSLFILYFFSFLALCSMVCSFVCFFVFLIFSAVVLALALLIGCCCCRCCCCGGVVVIVVVFFYVSF